MNVDAAANNFANTLTQNRHRHPEKVAVVDGEERLTYEQFDDRVDRTAAFLRSVGVGRGDRVALVMSNSTAFLEAYYGCVRLGAWCIPLNFRSSEDELRYALEFAGVAVVFADDVHAEAIERCRDVLVEPGVLVARDGRPSESWATRAEVLVIDRPTVTDEPVAWDDVQRVMFTSGTTSRPKASTVTHGQVTLGALTRLAEFGLGEADVSLTVGPLYHVAALDTFTTAMLYAGGTVVLHRSFEPDDVLDTLAEERVTNCWLSPTMLNRIFQLPRADSMRLPDLRVVLGGGEKAPVRLLEQMQRAWSSVGYYDGYGMTECQGLATVNHARDAVRKRGSVGRPARGREVQVVGSGGEPVGADVDGEILVRGPFVTPGYYRDEAATTAAIDDQGWLHTGDVGRVDEDGYLYVVDRLKDMIRSGGENVASPEIERVIYELDDVVEVAVVAGPDPRWTEVPVAFVVTRSTSLDDDTVRSHCRERLASFKVPRDVIFVEELPRSASGKVLKRTLRDWTTDLTHKAGRS